MQDEVDALDFLGPTILPTTDILFVGGYDESDYYKWFNGSFCATPYAAGVGALIKSLNYSWTPAQIRARVGNTATDVQNIVSEAGWDRYIGYGLVNAGAALSGNENIPPVAEGNGPYSGKVETEIVADSEAYISEESGKVGRVSTADGPGFQQADIFKTASGWYR